MYIFTYNMNQIKPFLDEHNILKATGYYKNEEMIILNSIVKKILPERKIDTLIPKLINKNIIVQKKHGRTYYVTLDELLKVLKYVKKTEIAQEFYDKLLKLKEEIKEEKIDVNYGGLINKIINKFKENNINILTITSNNVNYFKGNEIALGLGFDRTREALFDHISGKYKTTYGHLCKELKNKPFKLVQNKTIFITEIGIYELILTNKTPECEVFKTLIVEDILPSINKTGNYSL